MASTEEKKRIIMDHEAWFARNLSHKVIKKPTLALWMILIPVFFVFFMLEFQRANASRKPFVEDYMKARERAMEAAFRLVEEGEEPDMETLSGLADVPGPVRKTHGEWLKVAIKHYCSLLRADGKDFPSMARSAYRNKTNLMLAYNLLGEAEKKMDEALVPHLLEEVEDVSEVVREMQEASEMLRRQVVEEFFS